MNLFTQEIIWWSFTNGSQNLILQWRRFQHSTKSLSMIGLWLWFEYSIEFVPYSKTDEPFFPTIYFFVILCEDQCNWANLFYRCKYIMTESLSTTVLIRSQLRLCLHCFLMLPRFCSFALASGTNLFTRSGSCKNLFMRSRAVAKICSRGLYSSILLVSNINGINGYRSSYLLHLYIIIYTVVILINATTLMHKSSFSTNNFGNNHFGKSTRNKIFLEFLADCNGVCLKEFRRIEQKLENVFLAKFSILLRIS